MATSVSDFPDLNRTTTTATIANGASLSGAVNLEGSRLLGIAMPAAWTAANLTIKTSVDGTTYQDAYDADGAEITIVVGGASRNIHFSDQLHGVRWLKLRSGTTSSAVNQGADRTLTLFVEQARR